MPADSTAPRTPSIVLLGVASGLSVFGMAIVVPSMASIADRFDADFASVQFVISMYLFGLASAQPVSGFLCDRLGRRPVLLTGFAVFVAASLLCAYATTLEMLIVGRFLQAIGVSVGTVATRAILRDTRSDEGLAEAMSWIAAIMGVAPVLAPVFGGYLDVTLGYSSIFLLTAGAGGVVLLGMLLRLDETLPADDGRVELRRLMSGYRVLLTSTEFMGFTFIYAFVQGTFFSFLAIGAPYFETAFGIGAERFGLIWGVLAVAYIAGASSGARLTASLGAARVMQLSVSLLLISGLLMLALVWPEPATPLRVLLPLGLMMFVAGAATPGAMAGAVRPHPSIAGTASGLSSAIGLVFGGAFSIAAGLVFDAGIRPIALLMFGSCVLTALGWMLARRGLRNQSSSV